MGDFVSLETLVEGVRDGMSLAIPTDHAGVAMAATAGIIARRPKNLHLVCVPISGIQADMLIGEDYMQTRRFWLSYATAVLFIQPGLGWVSGR